MKLHEITWVAGIIDPFALPGNRKPQWSWDVTAFQEVLDLLKTAEPYFLSRRGARARELSSSIEGHLELKRRYCPSGHDKDAVGVNSEGICSECRKQSERRRRAKQKVSP